MGEPAGGVSLESVERLIDEASILMGEILTRQQELSKSIAKLRIQLELVAKRLEVELQERAG